MTWGDEPDFQAEQIGQADDPTLEWEDSSTIAHGLGEALNDYTLPARNTTGMCSG